MPALPAGARLHHPQAQDHGLESRLDNELIEACRSAIEGGTPIRLERTVRNVNRTVGAMLSGEIARKHRSEEHTSELQSLMRISYAVFCLKKKKSHYCLQQSTCNYNTTHI